MKVITKGFLFFLIGGLWAGCQTAVQHFPEESAELVLLGDTPEFQAMPIFEALLKTSSNDPQFEKLRRNYLYKRLAGSQHEFIRNGKAHNGAKASLHLKWKTIRHGQNVFTAEQFIDEIADGSKKTGDPYLIRVGKQGLYPTTVVLKNELRLLDKAVAEKKHLLEVTAENMDNLVDDNQPVNGSV